MAAFGLLGSVAVALAGCGRVGFDPATDAGVGDPEIDAPTAVLIPLCERVTGELYCSDFEGGVRNGAGTSGAVFVAGGGWSGSDGYQVTASPGQMPHLGFNLPAAMTSGELHIGAQMYLAPGPASANFVVVAQVISASFEKVSFDFNVFDRVQLVNAIGAGGKMGPNNGFPRGRWACFELVVVVAPAGSGGRVEVFIDGVSALAGFEDTATAPATGFTRVELGALSSGMNTATEVMAFDNWIISTQPIGCP